MLPFALAAPIASALKVTPNGYYGASRTNRPATDMIHKGLDLAAARGEPVFSMTAGTVRTGFDPPVKQGGNGGGSFVAVRVAGAPHEILYMHLDSVNVSTGQSVDAGQQVGTAGSSGAENSGVHLHIQIQTTTGGKKQHYDWTDDLAAIGGAVRRAASAAAGGGVWIALGAAALAGAWWWKRRNRS